MVRKGNRHRVVTEIVNVKDLPKPIKVQGRFFTALVTKHINGCQECYEEYAKRHK